MIALIKHFEEFFKLTSPSFFIQIIFFRFHKISSECRSNINIHFYVDFFLAKFDRDLLNRFISLSLFIKQVEGIGSN
jgi:hypothetical protein